MEYQISPPKKWIKIYHKDLNIYSKIFKNYDNKDIVFEIIKKNRDIKKLD